MMIIDKRPPLPTHHDIEDKYMQCAWGHGTLDDDDNIVLEAACDCEDPANPWPREPTEGPKDCSCFICYMAMPRSMRGRLDGCESKNHHCESCHERRICSALECKK